MNRVLEFVVKLLLFLILLPCLVGLALQVILVVGAVLLPWLLLLSVIAGVVAGITAAVSIRRRMPTRATRDGSRAAGPPLRDYRVRRPRGPAGRRR